MISSLKYVEEAAETGLAVARKATVKVVGGIRLESSVPDESSVSGYRKDSERLRDELRAMGVEPVAVLPRTWWSHICERSGLLKVRGDQSAMGVRLSEGVRKVESAVESRSVDVGVGSFAVMLAALLYMIWTVPGKSAWDAALISVLTSFFVFLAAVAIGWITSLVLSNSRAFARRIVDRSLASLLDAEARGTIYGVEATVGFRLPDPTPDVVDAITRVSDSALFANVRVCAPLEAFSFDRSVGDMVYARMKREAEERRRELRALMADPIVFVERGQAVAIVAQYGDLDIEKEVVDQAIRMSLS